MLLYKFSDNCFKQTWDPGLEQALMSGGGDCATPPDRRLCQQLQSGDSLRRTQFGQIITINLARRAARTASLKPGGATFNRNIRLKAQPQIEGATSNANFELAPHPSISKRTIERQLPIGGAIS